ncbi:hypothetical protein GWC77_08060 [Paraburkholderia sp. NMBU_R16]|uniref:hypothetical protein n=1 Tax=Paraburkholderia sp. NMBU_R16 TaxID=2698676 RepID=UPI0015675FE8|nr:hypothetical protein [Paraburkholderia sp. NMBU_R16]NRO95888.1 hypothetical protein [Paraburkholderia sp. NMBU_R16]
MRSISPLCLGAALAAVSVSVEATAAVIEAASDANPAARTAASRENTQWVATATRGFLNPRQLHTFAVEPT